MTGKKEQRIIWKIQLKTDFTWIERKILFFPSFFWHSFRISFARSQLFIYELLYIRCDVLFILHRCEISSQCKDTLLHICCEGGREGIVEERGWIPDIHQDTTDQFFWHSQGVKRLLLLMIFSILDLIWILNKYISKKILKIPNFQKENKKKILIFKKL